MKRTNLLISSLVLPTIAALAVAAPASAERQDHPDRGRPTTYQLTGDPAGSKFEGIGADEAIAFANRYAPEHLLVLGGGYVGLEFAQMFRRFGSQVTVVEMGPRVRT